MSEAFHYKYQGKGQNLHKKSNDPQVNKVLLSYVVQCCINVYTESLIWSRDYAVYHSVIKKTVLTSWLDFTVCEVKSLNFRYGGRWRDFS